MGSHRCSWRHVPWTRDRDALTRSSNSLAVLHNRAFIFGGERQPRTPVDNVLYEVELESGAVTAHAHGPEARVGAGLAAVKGERALFLWGGRGGKAMTALPGTLHRFDLETKTWSTVAIDDQQNEPEDRSFHVLCSSGDTIYLHAGCPAKGRLASLSALNNGRWTALPDAPAPARGGTALATLSDGRLARFGGFAGYELGGPLEIYDPATKSWSQAKLRDHSPEPAKRSVHGFVGLQRPIVRAGDELIAILLYGEADPAPPELGHDGAGKFHDDVWGLLRHDDAYEWTQLDAPGGPPPRGWFGVSPWYRDDGSTAVVMAGGLDEKNERMGDGLYILTIA